MPKPTTFSLAQLRATGTRTVEVEVEINGMALRVELRVHDDGEVDREQGRARMGIYDGALASLKALIHKEGSAEGQEANAALGELAKTAEDIAPAVVFDARRTIVKRILGRFAAWNVDDLPLEFDALYDAPISTEELQDIFVEVVAVPVVGKPK